MKLAKELPAGVEIGERTDGRAKPFFVRYGPNRTTESFASECERNDRAVGLASTAAEHGTAMLAFDPVKWRRLLAFEAKTGVTIDEAEEMVLRIRGNLRLNLTFEKAAEKYQALRKEEGLPKDWLDRVELHLGRFGEKHAENPMISIQPDHVRTWLADIKEAGNGPITIRHHFKNLNAFFDRAMKEKWCLENPCAPVIPPPAPEPNIKVIPAEDVFKLLKANRDLPIVGRLAMELFGGLRYSSAKRIVLEELKVNSSAVEMPGKKHKSTRRKFRQGQPPVFWAWIKHSYPACIEEISANQYRWQKRLAFLRANVTLPHNGLRRSFASYLIADTKNMPRVSYLMQHTSTAMTEKYEGVADENDARLVLSMTPDAVAGTWEKFKKKSSA